MKKYQIFNKNSNMFTINFKIIVKTSSDILFLLKIFQKQSKNYSGQLSLYKSMGVKYIYWLQKIYRVVGIFL